MSSRNYRDLIAWQKAMDLAVEVYKYTKVYPKEELYGLVSQSKRAASSVAANIAEGEGRSTLGDFVRFLRMAHGSLRELETHLILAERLGFLDATAMPQLMERCAEVGRIIAGLIRSKVAEQDS